MGSAQKPNMLSNERASCFLSLPHEHGTIREALKNVVEAVGGDVYYVNESEGNRLREEIKRNFSKSSILIADLSSAPSKKGTRVSSNGPRPAIMWEIGFAEAAGIQAIYLCDKKHTKHNIPAILSEEHFIEYDLHNVETAMNKVEAALAKIISRENACSNTFFRSSGYVDRRSCDLEVRYLQAKETVRILQLNLETVHAQTPTIIRALENNLNLFIQILTLDPFSVFAESRADQLAELPLTYRRKLYYKMKLTYEVLSKINQERWGLRIYDTFPTQIMFQIDDAIFHSIISLGRRSREMMHFEVQRSQPNAETTFEAHFATLWNRSKDYTQWHEINKKAVKNLIGEKNIGAKVE